ncbi:hypothetical protein E2C01_034575 [Portunus trituberculatus]|uniref:Uncharacterized protein n=1 Tax=Portunus trituberculatus TaxID=210409 RepID=A0A5B7F5Z0_PORTR|nr:hypothetical protein [Portunus trituberculatus]
MSEGLPHREHMVSGWPQTAAIMESSKLTHFDEVLRRRKPQQSPHFNGCLDFARWAKRADFSSTKVQKSCLG